MAPREREAGKFELICPSCGAKLTVDAELGKVLHHEPPPKTSKAPDLDHAAQLLQKEKARREALFRQSTEEEKVKSELLERKFEEAMKKTKDQPAGPPLKDIDLD
jgi:predicted amidophosphoribosyltransferase